MIKTVSGMTRGRAQDKRRRRRGIEEALDMSSTDILAIEAPLLSREEYESFKATVAENQSKLKQWADCAPGNFYHQYLLIEVRDRLRESFLTSFLTMIILRPSEPG